MSQTLKPTSNPNKAPCEPGHRAAPAAITAAASILGLPYAVASQLVWAEQTVAATLLTGFLAVVTLVWLWRVRPERG